ncbi:PREDICTED: nuclear polyadenylated RNA-binding protein 3-like, partial [Ipomoea nil]|uniref:nuclear polyadenylated RNA-binding protein 3-like n=1 Tax=Ipomoea nil TaxID=35883 RepID=UPI000901AA96
MEERCQNLPQESGSPEDIPKAASDAPNDAQSLPQEPTIADQNGKDHPRDPKGSASGTKDAHGNEIEEEDEEENEDENNDDETEDNNSGTDDTDDDDNDDNNNQQGGEGAEEEEPEDSHTILVETDYANCPQRPPLLKIPSEDEDLDEASSKNPVHSSRAIIPHLNESVQQQHNLPAHEDRKEASPEHDHSMH